MSKANESTSFTFPPLIFVFLAGFEVLAVEIIGTRALAPYFGMGLQVWAAQISSALLGISVGYYLGGVMSKSSSPSSAAGGSLIVAGVWLSLIPPLIHPVMTLMLRLSWYPAIWLSALVLYAVPMAALTVVSPLAVSVISDRGVPAGRAAGTVYFAGTMAGLIGALAAAFVFVQISVPAFFHGSGLACILAGILQLILQPGRKRMPVIAAVVGLTVSIVSAVTPARPAGHLPGLTVVDRRLGFDGCIEVLDNPQFRFLMVNNLPQTGFYRNSRRMHPAVEILFSPLAQLQPSGPDTATRRALVIGVGAGASLSVLKDAGYSVDAVEISPGVIDFAERYFGLDRSAFGVTIADGRYVLNTTANRYDLVFIDAYNGLDIAEHLYSIESFESVRRILNPGGVAVCNVLDAEASPLVSRVMNTMNRVFPECSAMRISPGDMRETPKLVNTLVWSHPQPGPARDVNRWIESFAERHREVIRMAKYDLSTFVPDPEALVVTDLDNHLNWQRRHTVCEIMQARARNWRVM